MMFLADNMSGMDGSWEGHDMRCKYLQGVGHGAREEMMWNANVDVFVGE